MVATRAWLESGLAKLSEGLGGDALIAIPEAALTVRIRKNQRDGAWESRILIELQALLYE